jgi:hypothetical protein
MKVVFPSTTPRPAATVAPLPGDTPYPEIHVSDVRLFKKCRLAWNWGSPLRMGLRKSLPDSNLWVGTAVHAALDLYYSHERTLSADAKMPHDWLLEWVPGEIARLRTVLGPERYLQVRDRFAENVDEAQSLLTQYGDWCIVNDHFDVQATEMEFRLPICNGTADFAGRLDGVVTDEKGKVWVSEFKTTAMEWDYDYLPIDEQKLGYSAVLRRMFESYGGIMYTFIHKRAPTQLRVLKSGRLSFARARITYTEALRQIRDNGLSAADYQLELRELLDQPNPFVTRVWLTDDRSTLYNWWRGLEAVAREMLDPEIPIYPSPNMMGCRMCSFREPCFMRAMGEDPQQFLAENYFRHERVESLPADVDEV